MKLKHRGKNTSIMCMRHMPMCIYTYREAMTQFQSVECRPWNPAVHRIYPGAAGMDWRGHLLASFSLYLLNVVTSYVLCTSHVTVEITIRKRRLEVSMIVSELKHCEKWQMDKYKHQAAEEKMKLLDDCDVCTLWDHEGVNLVQHHIWYEFVRRTWNLRSQSIVPYKLAKLEMCKNMWNEFGKYDLTKPVRVWTYVSQPWQARAMMCLSSLHKSHWEVRWHQVPALAFRAIGMEKVACYDRWEHRLWLKGYTFFEPVAHYAWSRIYHDYQAIPMIMCCNAWTRRAYAGNVEFDLTVSISVFCWFGLSVCCMHMIFTLPANGSWIISFPWCLLSRKPTWFH